MSRVVAVGFTGTQRGMTKAQAGRVAEWLTGLRTGGATEFHHGDCVGADAEAHDWAEAIGFRTVGHPCGLEGKRAFKVCDETWPVDDPLARNRAIVSACQVLVCAPGEPREVLRSGTWATVRYARAARIMRIVVHPDGRSLIGKKSGHEG